MQEILLPINRDQNDTGEIVASQISQGSLKRLDEKIRSRAITGGYKET